MSLADDDLRVSVRFDDDCLVFRLAGEIDASNAPAITDVVIASAGEFDGSLAVVDLTDVTFMDSTGLAELLKCRTDLGQLGIAIEVRNPSSNVRRLFEITGLTDLFG